MAKKPLKSVKIKGEVILKITEYEDNRFEVKYTQVVKGCSLSTIIHAIESTKFKLLKDGIKDLK